MNKELSWEKEFDKCWEGPYPGNKVRVRNFVRDLLATEKKALVEEIVKKYGFYNDGCGCCMDTELKTELKAKLKEMEKAEREE